MAAVAPAPRSTILPSKGIARVKSVLSGDTVILLGKPSSPKARAPEVTFTLENISSPRMASKSNGNIDEPGAFPAREWLRNLLVGKVVSFETRKQAERVYGLLLFTPPGGAAAEPINVAVEVVRNGNATPKSVDTSSDKDADGDEYNMLLAMAYDDAKQARRGVHGENPLVRSLKNSGEEFQALSLVQKSQKLGKQGRIKCVVEYVFDGSRYRVLVTDSVMGDLTFASFTLLLAGAASPRFGSTRTDPPTPTEEFAEEARQFVEMRLLQRELEISLHGTDKSGVSIVGTVHHPKGNIAVEILKNGLAKMSDWSVRMMSPLDVPALRIAENSAKRTNTGVWHSYTPPRLTGASEISGTVVEVISGDTIAVLSDGMAYDSEDKLVKISLASVRSPRLGSTRSGRADEPYCVECKDRLRELTIGKACKVQIHYERDIPMGEKTEKRQFGTVAVKNKPDVGEYLVSSGYATVQFHKDGEERSPRYDELRAAESVAKAAKKGLHSDGEYKRPSVNDLSDPRKAKAYSGSLMRVGKVKAIVEYCFNGARFKMLIPSENCEIMFAAECLRCPQPSPSPGSRANKPAEPFGDAAKRHARLTVHQRTVEIDCTGVTMGGVITGKMFVGEGGQRRDYSLELVGAGLATVDQRKIDHGEAPKQLVDAQAAAQGNRAGIWSLETAAEPRATSTGETLKEQSATIRVSEIRSGSNFFYHVANDDSVKAMDDSMKLFTKNNGTDGAPSDVKVNRVVAALFDDGSGKSWYRAKILEKDGAKATVLFVDHGNVAKVPIASHLRPLDMSLGIDRIPPVAKEASLALTISQPLSDENGLDAARMFQSLCWGKDLSATIFGVDDSGKKAVSIVADGEETVNEKLVSAGLARVAKPGIVKGLVASMLDGSAAIKLAADLNVAQELARTSRSGMWRYGDVGDDDDDEI